MNDNLIITFFVLLIFSPVIYQWFLLLKERKIENKKILKKSLKFTQYSFLTLIFISIIFGILSHTNFLNYERPMTFEKFDKITFQNFRGLEFFKKSLYGNKRFAYVVTSIECEINENSVTVQSFFYPSRSFVYNKNTNSKELLTHEKYHIKITELFVREAKKEISNLKIFNKNKIKEIIRKVKTKERAFQKEYDYNTFHSYVLSEQKKYERKVDSLLTLLSVYEKPKITINDKN
ncbi:hypothetical protein KO506_05155 [Polaribacter vadi]|uniref:hypothetical protein n=1 Tax=Polaribacter TaxID=52959 RepID=UPI001C07FC85|nr:MULTISPECIES: hypothetical protein [Polaribacter]MBU3010778.1 hypothetical protein [Polaribacter vadi]MDO6740589.1 hypothetical protein [Polaribacter sp. 1_MG-2023]